MGASYKFANSTGSYANAAAQSKYGSGQAGFAFKLRLKGDIWSNYVVNRVFRFPNRDGLELIAYQQDADYQLILYSGNNGNISWSIPSFTGSSSTYYVVYGEYFSGGAGLTMAIGDASGTLIQARTGSATAALGGTTGEIEFGPTVGAIGYTLDGAAIYSAVLSGTSRFSTPTSGDSNILGLYKFDEGTGTSVADATGGTSLTIAGSGTWNAADGAWDAGSTLRRRPVLLTTRRERKATVSRIVTRTWAGPPTTFVPPAGGGGDFFRTRYY